MENKYVGFLVFGIAILLIIIIFLFQTALKEIVYASCSMETVSCPMNKSINQQTYLALGIVGILVLVALVMVFSKPQERVIIKTKTIEKKPQKKVIDTSDLKPEERQVLKIIQENKTIFQAEIIEKTKLGKAKITRIIDRLEGKGFVERKRRGMTNIVVLNE